MFSLKNIFKKKAYNLTVSKPQKELLEIFIQNKVDFDKWAEGHLKSKIKFQFYYPTAVDFYYGEFKLFNAYFKKGNAGQLDLMEFKMTETNYDSIRNNNWKPFEDVILEFLTTLEETKKIALFEKRKALYEYESLCAKKPESEAGEQNPYFNPLPASSLQSFKPTS